MRHQIYGSIASLLVASAVAFVTKSSSSSPCSFVLQQRTRLFVTKENSTLGVDADHRAKSIFPEADFLTFTLDEHVPLGCTVEESMDAMQDYVFVTKITPGGFAEQAGLQVGDVLVAVTGLFGELAPVLESGVDKIKGLVSSVPVEAPLSIEVARGTEVMERHESAIVDLCQTTGVSDREAEECVVNFLKEGYYDVAADRDDEEEQCDDGSECMIDDMMNLWADEQPLPTTSGMSNMPDGGSVAKKAKPWSSRSSPSGTFVRDPVTGEMRNIDA